MLLTPPKLQVSFWDHCKGKPPSLGIKERQIFFSFSFLGRLFEFIQRVKVIGWVFPNLGIPMLCLLATLEGTRQRKKSQSWSHPGLTVLASIIPREKAVQGHHHLKIQARAQHSTLGCHSSPLSIPESMNHILSPLGNNSPVESISNPKTCLSSSSELVEEDKPSSDPSFPSLEQSIHNARP